MCRLNHSWLCTHEALLIGRWSTAAWRSFKANKRLNVVINTLTHSVKDVSHFGIVFLTIFLCALAILMKFDCKFYQVLVGDCYDCDGLCRQSVYCHRYFSSLELLQNPALAFQICSGYSRCSMFLYWPVDTRTGTRNLQFAYVSIPWFLCHTFVLNAKAMLGLPTLLGIAGACFKRGTEIGRLVPSCYISLCFHETTFQGEAIATTNTTCSPSYAFLCKQKVTFSLKAVHHFSILIYFHCTDTGLRMAQELKNCIWI